jgi:hypothetical protein
MPDRWLRPRTIRCDEQGRCRRTGGICVLRSAAARVSESGNGPPMAAETVASIQVFEGAAATHTADTLKRHV